jgi:hypothetical protein
VICNPTRTHLYIYWATGLKDKQNIQRRDFHAKRLKALPMLFVPQKSSRTSIYNNIGNDHYAISANKWEVAREAPMYKCFFVKCWCRVNSRILPGKVNPCTHAYLRAWRSLRHLPAASPVRRSPLSMEDVTRSSTAEATM